MKTVFKVGMKVYDQINFPDMEGKVVKIHEDESKYPLGVCFNKKMSIHYYDLEGRFRKDNIPTLSTKPYKVELQGFEQKTPAPTFEEAEEWMKKEYAKGSLCLMMRDVFEALRKLIVLRDYYNEGWKPKNNSYVHIITTRNGELVKDCLMGDFRVLYFESMEIRNTFFEEQRELLEIAKPLL